MSGVVDVIQHVLVPCLILFFCGWLCGVLDVLKSPAVGVLNAFCLYFPIPCAILLAFFTFISIFYISHILLLYFLCSYKLGGEELLFIVPLLIHKLFFAFLLAVPFLFSKTYSLKEYCSLYLHAVYANCITYGKFDVFLTLLPLSSSFLSFYLITYYPSYPMSLLCGLATLPDSIVGFTLGVFLLEYAKEREKLKQHHGSDFHLSKRKLTILILIIILRVIKNPIIWGSAFGIIMNYAVLQTKGSVPIWMKQVTQYGANSVLCVSMFTLGTFAFAFNFVFTFIFFIPLPLLPFPSPPVLTIPHSKSTSPSISAHSDAASAAPLKTLSRRPRLTLRLRRPTQLV